MTDAILAHRDQPILITCRNDEEVLALHEAVKSQLKVKDSGFDLSQLTADTNSSNKVEAESLQQAGQTGFVTFSSRMGRGTDIKPVSTKGLLLVRTYLAERRTVKQEYGRQGRNGMAGSYIDILDRSDIEEKYQQLKKHYPGEVKQCRAYHQQKLEKR